MAPAPESVEMKQIKEEEAKLKKMARQEKLRNEFEKEIGPYLYTIELTARSLEDTTTINWDEKQIVGQLRKIDVNVDAVMVGVNVRYTGALSDKKMQSKILTSLTTLNDALKHLKMVGKYCCYNYYNKSKRVRKLCEMVYAKTGNVRSNFTMDINVSGNATIGGVSNNVADTSYNEFATEDDDDY